MGARSLNKVQLIGNLTRDPELRYTPRGTAVCSFGVATNRTWATDAGEKREDAEFHRIVAWNKLAELCSQLLFKGRKVFVEGRLQTRQWTAQDGTPRQTTEIVISDMIILDSKSAAEEARAEAGASVGSVSSGKASTDQPEPKEEKEKPEPAIEEKKTSSSAAGNDAQAADDQKSSSDDSGKEKEEEEETEVKAEDIPF